MFKIVNIVKTIEILLCLILIYGCVTAPLADTALDSAAKYMQPPDGQAMVYVMRESSPLVGQGAEFEYIVNGKRMVLTNGTYLYFFSTPGQISVDNGIFLNVEAGRKYYVKAKHNLPLSKWAFNLSVVDASIGISLLNDMSLIRDFSRELIITAEFTQKKKKEEEDAWLRYSQKNTVGGYEEFIAKYPDSQMTITARKRIDDEQKRQDELKAKEAREKNENERVLKENSFEALVQYLSKPLRAEYRSKAINALSIRIAERPDALELFDKYLVIYPELRQNLVDEYAFKLLGPQGMRIYQISALQKKGTIGADILAAKILSSTAKYKDFSLPEIERLKEMGLTDNVIAAMIKSTALALKKEELASKKQEFNEEKSRHDVENRKLEAEDEALRQKQDEAARQKQDEAQQRMRDKRVASCKNKCNQRMNNCFERCNSIAVNSTAKSIGAMLTRSQYNNLNDAADMYSCKTECETGASDCELGCDE